MKLIKVDNYNRETFNDILIAEKINEEYTEKIAELFNENPNNPECDWYRVVEDDYKLYRFEP